MANKGSPSIAIITHPRVVEAWVADKGSPSIPVTTVWIGLAAPSAGNAAWIGLAAPSAGNTTSSAA